MVIDTHAHLTDSQYTNIDKLIKDFRKNNLSKVFSVSYDLDSAKKSISLANKYPDVYAIIGFHPTELKKFDKKSLTWLEKNASNKKVIAIGEIGLDYHYPKDTDKEKQKEVFIAQIKLADKLGLPIVIHERDAVDDVFQILDEYKTFINHGGVLHCFGHNYDTYKKFEKLGYYVSFGGVITFKNAGEVLDTVKKVPLNRIILETDCPYLTPVPYRGKQINEPKFVNFVAQKIAELKNISLEEVEKETTKNVSRLFPKTEEIK